MAKKTTNVKKNAATKTSLPPSMKKAVKSAPTNPAEKEAPKKIRVNLDALLDAIGRSTVRPEEINIAAFGMSEKTRSLILRDLGINPAEYEGYLYGIRVFPSESIPLGKVQLCDPQSKVIDTLTVAEV